LLATLYLLYTQEMSKPKTRRATARKSLPSQPDERMRWMTEIRQRTVVDLKVRAALERRPMHEVLEAAIAAYLATAVGR